MGGVKRFMKKVEAEYLPSLGKLMVAVDIQGVLKSMRKGRGFCGELESRVTMMGKRLMEKGWRLVSVWVLGHVGIVENE